MKTTKQIKESITILDAKAWGAADKRFLHYEYLPYPADEFLKFKHSNELQEFLDRHEIRYCVNWVQESNLHPLFADMFNGYMKG